MASRLRLRSRAFHAERWGKTRRRGRRSRPSSVSGRRSSPLGRSPWRNPAACCRRLDSRSRVRIALESRRWWSSLSRVTKAIPLAMITASSWRDKRGRITRDDEVHFVDFDQVWRRAPALDRRVALIVVVATSLDLAPGATQLLRVDVFHSRRAYAGEERHGRPLLCKAAAAQRGAGCSRILDRPVPRPAFVRGPAA